MPPPFRRARNGCSARPPAASKTAFLHHDAALAKSHVAPVLVRFITRRRRGCVQSAPDLHFARRHGGRADDTRTGAPRAELRSWLESAWESSLGGGRVCCWDRCGRPGGCTDGGSDSDSKSCTASSPASSLELWSVGKRSGSDPHPCNNRTPPAGGGRGSEGREVRARRSVPFGFRPFQAGRRAVVRRGQSPGGGPARAAGAGVAAAVGPPFDLVVEARSEVGQIFGSPGPAVFQRCRPVTAASRVPSSPRRCR